MSKKHLKEALQASQIQLQSVSLLTGFKEDEGIYSLHYVDNGKKLLVGTGAESIKIIPGNVKAGDDAYVVTHTQTIKQNQPLGGLPITCIREIHSSTGALSLASSVSGYVYKFDWSQPGAGFHAVVTEAHNQIGGFDINTDGKLLATVGSSCTVRLYDTTGFGSVREYHSVKDMDFDCQSGHTMRLFACKFDVNDPNILLTAGWDNVVKIWDVRVHHNEPVRHLSGPHICCNDGLDIKFRKVLTGSYVKENALQIWDLREASVIETFSEDHVYCAKFAPHDTVISASAVSKTFTRYKEQNTHGNKDKLCGSLKLESPVYSMALSTGQPKACAGCFSGEIQFVSL